MLGDAPHHPSNARRSPSRWHMGLAILMLGAAACARDITVTVRAGDRPPNPDPTSRKARTRSLKVLYRIPSQTYYLHFELRLESTGFG